jgi:predicted hydrolase (HD superfamily)
MDALLTRDAAWALLTEWTTSESLRKHALAVEASVRGYARQFGEDEDAWGFVALLHDFDYERYQTPADHPFRGCEELAAPRLSGVGDACDSLARRLFGRAAAEHARKDALRVRRDVRIRDRGVTGAPRRKAFSISSPPRSSNA